MQQRATESVEENRLALAPYHRFTVEGRTYAVNIDRCRCVRLGDRAAAFLAAWEGTSGIQPEEDVRCELVKAGLLAADPGKPWLDEAARLERDRRAAARWLTTDGARTDTLCLMMAQECNMACVYCYGAAGTYGGGGLMTEETARRSVDWLVRHSGDVQKLALSFFGGEPLLNLPVVRSTVAYAKEAGEKAGKTFSFSITTNASLVDAATIDFLRANRFTLIISFDGTPAAQNSNRPFRDGRPSYDAVAPRIKELLAAFPAACGRATLYGETDPGEVLAAMKEIGFQSCHMVAASGCLLTDGPSEKPSYHRGGDRTADFQREAAAFVAAVKRRDLAETARRIKDRDLSKVSSITKKIFNIHRLFFCGAGRAYLAVDVDGGIYPCHRFVGMEEYRLGGISEPDDPPRGLFHKTPVAESAACRQCWLRYVCGGGCTYANIAATGDFFQPDPAFCRQNRQTTETLLDAACQMTDADWEFLYKNNIVVRPPCPLDF